MTVDEALAFVRTELEHAQATHKPFNSRHEGYAVIREELDELWDAVKAKKHYGQYSGAAALEAVQVAAMAVRFLVDLCEQEGLSAGMPAAGKQDDPPSGEFGLNFQHRL